MGQDQILEKLRRELEKEIHEECQVVYNLSRIRKILEINGQKPKYKLLNFYCNWVLHSKLDQPSTVRLISDMFYPSIGDSEEARPLARKFRSNHSNFFKLNELKDELAIFLKEYNLSQYLVRMDVKWIIFIRLLLDTIEESPIILGGNPGEINRVVLEKRGNRNYAYKFSLVDCRGKPVIKFKLKNMENKNSSRGRLGNNYV